jgi:hypothetical protein
MFRYGVRAVFVLVLAVFVVSLPAVAEAAQAPHVSIQDLRKNWQRYDGKSVQVRGQIDNCNTRCAICPEDMTSATYDNNRCLSLDFGGEDSHGKLVANQANLAMQVAFRFATVTVQARLNSQCLFDETGKPVTKAVCIFDTPAANLGGGRVLQIHARKSARDGLAVYVFGPLVPAAVADRDAMLEEFNAVVWGDYATPEMFTAQLPVGIISDKRRDYVYVGDGMGCVCLDDSCEGRWPTRLFPGMDSAGNPFHCWQMVKTEKGWRVVPNFLQ